MIFGLTPEEKKKKASEHWKELTRSFMFKDNWFVFWAGILFGVLLWPVGRAIARAFAYIAGLDF